MSEVKLRSTMETIPNNQNTLERLNIPLCIISQPLYDNSSSFQMDSFDVICKCGSFFSNKELLYLDKKLFRCEVCGQTNLLKDDQIDYLYQIQNSEQNIDLTDYEITYSMENRHTKQSIIFAIDTSLEQENFSALIKQLFHIVESIDFQYTQVGVVSFNKNIELYKVYSEQYIQSIVIGLDQNPSQRQQLLNLVKNFQQQFFVDNKETLIDIIESIECSINKEQLKFWAQRATGFALQTIQQLIQTIQLDYTQLFLFIGGSCTVGPGKVSHLDIKEYLRKQQDLEENEEIKKMSNDAQKFYSDLAAIFCSINCSVNILAYSLEQFGLFEMKDFALKQTGILMLNEEFKQHHFQLVMNRLFQNQENLFNSSCSTRVLSNPLLKICGSIGSLWSLNRNQTLQGTNQIGESNTNEWYVGGINNDSTFAYFFEINNQVNLTSNSIAIQIQTLYRNHQGLLCWKVQTKQLGVSNNKNQFSYLDFIDQYCLISVYSKIAALRSMTQDSVSVWSYLDNKLIQILKIFSSQAEIPFALQYLPQYFYHLRKSQFVSKSNLSLDEMIYFRAHILRETLDHSLIMVQPQILQYNLNEEPWMVQANLDCLKNDTILLVDTFFSLLVWKGKVIKEWEKAGYHLQEEYEHLKQTLLLPLEDRDQIQQERLFQAEILEATEGSPFERVLKSKLNPERTKNSILNEGNQEENYFTEDVTLSLFMEKLLAYLKEQPK